MCLKGTAQPSLRSEDAPELLEKGTEEPPVLLEKMTSGEHHRDTEGGGGHYFLTSSAAAAIPKYQYAGADLSLIYKYVLAPTATFLVTHCTPRTLAPNTITFSALVLMFAAYCLVWYHCPNMDEYLTSTSTSSSDDAAAVAVVVPSWIFAFNCAAMLIYQTLDNMDGRQARRTGASSPLGLLFDHGCDAINSIFGSANWIAAMGLSTQTDALAIWVLIVFPMAAFYIATWEEYFTGKLILPIINGPSEGLILGAALSLTSAIKGAEFWHGTEGFDAVVAPYILPHLPAALATSSYIPEDGVRNCDMIALMTVLALTREVLTKTCTTCRRYGLAAPLLNLAPFVALAAGALYIGATDPAILVRQPRTCLHLIAALFVEMVTQLMLDHMTAEKFRAARPALVPLGALALLVSPVMRGGGAGAGGGVPALSDAAVDDYVLAYAVGVGVYLSMKIRIVIHEICAVLGIWCFDIVTPRSSTSRLIGDKKKQC